MARLILQLSLHSLATLIPSRYFDCGSTRKSLDSMLEGSSCTSGYIFTRCRDDESTNSDQAYLIL